jgi:hypothetical protein
MRVELKPEPSEHVRAAIERALAPAVAELRRPWVYASRWRRAGISENVAPERQEDLAGRHTRCFAKPSCC